MMSQIVSCRSTQHTPLYENEQFESGISQRRLLLFMLQKSVRSFYYLSVLIIFIMTILNILAENEKQIKNLWGLVLNSKIVSALMVTFNLLNQF